MANTASNIRDRLRRWCQARWFICGPARLVRILFGWRAERTHETATHVLMILGFGIEWVVLQRAVTASAYGNLPDVVAVVGWCGVLAFCLTVIPLLLFHQFVIFRNFSLPSEVQHHNARAQVTVAVQSLTVGVTVSQAQSDDLGAAIAAFSPTRRIQLRRTQKFIEIGVYLCFGILTGEAGYFLTVVYTQNPLHWLIRIIIELFGTSRERLPKDQSELGMTLECAFVFGAFVICLFILMWDVVVSLSAELRETYRKSLWMYFKNDVLCLCFWACLFVAVTPRFQVGNRVYLAKGVWIFLLTSSLSYIFVMGGRLVSGLMTLGKETSYAKSRLREI